MNEGEKALLASLRVDVDRLEKKLAETIANAAVSKAAADKLAQRVAHLEPIIARLEEKFFPRCKECGQELHRG